MLLAPPLLWVLLLLLLFLTLWSTLPRVSPALAAAALAAAAAALAAPRRLFLLTSRPRRCASAPDEHGTVQLGLSYSCARLALLLGGGRGVHAAFQHGVAHDEVRPRPRPSLGRLSPALALQHAWRRPGQRSRPPPSPHPTASTPLIPLPLSPRRHRPPAAAAATDH